MVIDYITPHDPRNINAWSGLNYFIMKALEDQGATINIITGMHAKPNFGLKWRWHLYNFFGLNYQYERTHCYSKQFGDQVNSQLSTSADIVLSTSTPALAYIKTNKPVFLYTDATFDNLAEYYNHFSNLSASSKRMGDAVEKLAMHNCAQLFYASKWAADSAIHYYKANPQKVQVVPFGANLFGIPNSKFIDEIIQHRNLNPLKVLFVGVEFERKGGQLAVDIVQELNNRGILTILIMAGMIDLSSRNLPPFVIDVGLLDNSTDNQKEELKKLYKEAHIFLLPTKRECYGVVFAEASAFGLPIFTIKTGGVSTAVNHNVNGYLFEEHQPLVDWVDKIVQLVENNEAYLLLSHRSRLRYEAELNWQIAAKSMMKKFEKYINTRNVF